MHEIEIGVEEMELAIKSPCIIWWRNKLTRGWHVLAPEYSPATDVATYYIKPNHKNPSTMFVLGELRTFDTENNARTFKSQIEENYRNLHIELTFKYEQIRVGN